MASGGGGRLSVNWVEVDSVLIIYEWTTNTQVVGQRFFIAIASLRILFTDFLGIFYMLLFCICIYCHFLRARFVTDITIHRARKKSTTKKRDVHFFLIPRINLLLHAVLFGALHTFHAQLHQKINLVVVMMFMKRQSAFVHCHNVFVFVFCFSFLS